MNHEDTLYQQEKKVLEDARPEHSILESLHYIIEIEKRVLIYNVSFLARIIYTSRVRHLGL